MEEITIYTRVYNTEKYLMRCLDSVINQTYKNFKHIIIDNGCTDGCTEILKDYAEKYPWVQLIRFENNTNKILEKIIDGKQLYEYIDTSYFCTLDSDDWLEEDFLEKMLNLIKSEDADIVSTGSYFHEDKKFTVTGVRSADKCLIISKDEFANYYTYYHKFFRTVWGKLYKSDVYKSIFKKYEKFAVSYGSDTLEAFECIRNSNKICVDNSVLHHYQLHTTSSSNSWNSQRIDSDVILYNDAKGFLKQYGDISIKNQHFIDSVYINAISDTLNVLVNFNIDDNEKSKEIFRILNNQIAIDIFKKSEIAEIANIKFKFLKQSIHIVSKLENKDIFNDILSIISPKSSSYLNYYILLLFSQKSFFQVFLNNLILDNVNQILKFIFDEIKSNNNLYLANFVQQSKNNVLIHKMTDASFIIEYSDVCYCILINELSEALDLMTSYIKNNHLVNEKFYQLYLMLSSILKQSNEFIFGKISLALFYISSNDKKKCIEILSELTEMGIENDVIEKIKLILDNHN